MTDSGLPDFDLWWDYDDPAETEKRFRGLLPIAEPSGNRSYILQLLTQIARTHSLRGQFDAAHALLDQVEAQLEDGDSTAQVRYRLERGRALNSAEQPAQALPLFIQAWQLARESDEDFHAIDAAHMAAIAEASPEQQLDWNHQALALAEHTADTRAKKWPASLHNNIGWTYHDAGDYARALDHFEQALTWRQQQGNIRTIRNAQWCIGRCLRSLGRLDEALAIQQTLREEHAQAGTSDGYVSEEIAECLLALNRQDEAKPYFARAYAELSQDDWLAAHEPERLARLKALSE